jgi:hypothetical protein
VRTSNPATIIFLHGFKRLVYLIEKLSVFSEVGTEFLNITVLKDARKQQEVGSEQRFLQVSMAYSSTLKT